MCVDRIKIMPSNSMDRFIDLIEWIAALFIGIVTVDVFVTVMLRYFFNIAIPDNIIGYQRLLRYAEGRGANARRLVVGICMENDLQDYSSGQGAWDTTPLETEPMNRRCSSLRMPVPTTMWSYLFFSA